MPTPLERKHAHKKGPRQVEAPKPVLTRTEARIERIVRSVQLDHPDAARALIARELTAHVVERRNRFHPGWGDGPAHSPATRELWFPGFVNLKRRPVQVGDRVRACISAITGRASGSAYLSKHTLPVIAVISPRCVRLERPDGTIFVATSWVRVP